MFDKLDDLLIRFEEVLMSLESRELLIIRNIFRS